METIQDSYCKWLHTLLEGTPLRSYPFEVNCLPLNGIYFFYDKGEIWGHGGEYPRIVRIGTHRDGNFRSRIAEHYVKNNMNLSTERPKPSDRSIFRKNIGRAFLNKEKSDYLPIWEKDFMKIENKRLFGSLRDISIEKSLEDKISEYIRNNMSFRYLIISKQEDRLGDNGFEKRLIGTVAACSCCKPSQNWLGGCSPIEKINVSGLWQVQHLNSRGISEIEKEFLLKAADLTCQW